MIASLFVSLFQAPQPNVNMTVGLAATLAACCCSGLAGVYFEKILKKSEVGLMAIRDIMIMCLTCVYASLSSFCRSISTEFPAASISKKKGHASSICA